MSQSCLCDQCSALCCRYFALPIDTPEEPSQFDDIRWYLAHENVHIFVEDGDWYLAVQTRCQYLRDDNKCGIYEDRPRICREYTTDNCDYHVGAYEFEQYFTSADQIEAYAQSVLGKRYTDYCMKQRKKNTGQQNPDRQEVLASRRRPKLMGHPSLYQPRHVTLPSPGGKITVPLSIGGVKR
jgi:Fe-S-cluster containining protein